MYYLLGITIVLAVFVIANLALTLAAAFAWKLIAARTERIDPSIRGYILFALRLIPAAAALVLVLGFVAPAYVLYEPYGSGEVVSSKLLAIAAVGTCGIVLAIFRIIQTWRATSQLTSEWLRGSREMRIQGVSLPIYCIEHSFPLLAVVGFANPKIFIAEDVLATLSDEELRVAIAHEYGHLQAGDNFKSLLMRICRDLAVMPLGREIERAWKHNSEALADDFAVRASASRAVDLASALVKISRIVPKGELSTLPAGAYFVGKGGEISSRIRRLLRFSHQVAPSSLIPARSLSILRRVFVMGFGLLLAFHLADGTRLIATHRAIEYFVRIMQ